MAYDKPNYTQAPNAFFDEHLSEIKSLAELKVTLIVLRHTVGWHKETVDLTLTELMGKTGMSRPSVLEGVGLALERGTIRREKKGRSFTYEGNILSVKKVYRSDDPIGKESEPLSVKNLDQSAASPINVLKKEKKQPKPSRAERYMLPPDSMLDLSAEDFTWLRQKAPHVGDYERATEKWYLKQQTAGGKSKTMAEWRASWELYMMNYSDGESSRGNGSSNQKPVWMAPDK